MNLTINADITKTGPSPYDIHSGKYSSIKIDLSDIQFFTPAVLVRVRCIIDLAFDCKLKVFIIPPSNENVKNYGGRMGLFDGTGYTYPHNKQDSAKFFPLLKIVDDRDCTLEDKCHAVFNPLAPGSLVTELADIFGEIANNIYFHSGPKGNQGWGYAHAQVYDDKGIVEVAVSDVGVGFLKSYQRTGQDRGRNEEQIILESFNELESSLNNKSEIKYRGIGLYETLDFIKKSSGKIRVLSGNTCVEWTCVKEFESSALNYKLCGVLFEMSVPFK